jgi:four helix bundle protein
MGTFKKLEDIIAWQKARDFCKELKQCFPLFTQAREFELLNQLKSSSGSVMDNIAEGFGRMGNAEFRHFLTVSHGSIMESISQLTRSYDWQILDLQQFEKLRLMAEETERLILSLFNHLLQSEHKGVKFRTP